MSNRRSKRPWLSHSGSEYDFIYPTYEELKKDLKKRINESPDGVVDVIRTRRGEWGQWFEKWELINNKPRLIEETWL